MSNNIWSDNLSLKPGNQKLWKISYKKIQPNFAKEDDI